MHRSGSQRCQLSPLLAAVTEARILGVYFDLYAFGFAYVRTRISMPASFHSGFKLSLQCNMRISYHCCRRKGRIIPSGFRFELNAFNELVYWNAVHNAFNGGAFRLT